MSKVVDLLKFTNNINNNLIAFTSNIESSVISTIDSSTINTFVGMIASFSMTTTSEWRTTNRWIICDGSAISRTVYSDLFSVISTTWGVGDGSSTFNLPDLRGEFLRGFDNGAGTDPNAQTRTGGNAIGSSQAAANKDHGHRVDHDDIASYARYSHAINTTFGSGDGAVALTYWGHNGSYYNTQSTRGDNSSPSSESRPRNKYVQFCIKF